MSFRPYTFVDLERILPRLADVLSIPENQKNNLAKWVKREFPDEIQGLGNAFTRLKGELHHKWADALLATLPDSAWVEGPGGLLRLQRAGPIASMRFLSTAISCEDRVVALNQSIARQTLHEELLAQMPAAKKLCYVEMLSWQHLATPEQAKENPLWHTAADQRAYALAGDTKFGLALSELENLFNQLAHSCEQQWRASQDFPEDKTIPTEVRNSISHSAMQHLCTFIARSHSNQVELGSVRDSLIALVSANVSCNRVLLELAAQDNRGFEAEEMCFAFLTALNEKGVVEIPLAFDSVESSMVEPVLRETLKSWFAFSGELLARGTILAQHMTLTEIDKIVQWSAELQQAYIEGRGGLQGALAAQRAHGSPRNRFLFALVLTAAFYSHQKTEREVPTNKAQRNLMYALFPSRPAIKWGHPLTAHAKDALLKAYGLVFYGNSGWELKAEGIKAYSVTTQLRRAYIQLAVNFAVKERSSRELLALYLQLKAAQQDRATGAKNCTMAEP